MRVLVLWADNHSPNLGVRVLAAGAERAATLAFGDDAEVACQDFRGTDTGVRVSPVNLAQALLLRRGPLHELIRRQDVVFDTGAGDSFTDIYGAKRLIALLGTQFVVSRRPVLAFLPQTLGPFKTAFWRSLARRSLNRAVLVGSRDSITTTFATEQLGVEVGRYSDLVFLLDRPERPADPTHDVMLNVSGLLWQPNHHVDSELYRDAILRTAKELMAAGRKVTLLAHVLDSDNKDNDVPALKEAAALLPGVEIAVPTDLDDARAMIADSRLLIGARMHSVLNSLSVGVPALAWAYSRKFEPLLNDIEWDASIDLRTTKADDIVSGTLAFVESVPTAEVQQNVARVADRGRARTMAFVEDIRAAIAAKASA